MTHKQNFVSVLTIVILYSIFCIISCQAQGVNITKIIQIESSGNPDAYNPFSKAIGLCQITPICLLEWNNYHPKAKYYDTDLFNPVTNTLIGEWYINHRIPQMLKYYKIEDTIESRLICYNWGIGKYRSYLRSERSLPKETANYLKKYKNAK